MRTLIGGGHYREIKWSVVDWTLGAMRRDDALVLASYQREEDAKRYVEDILMTIVRGGDAFNGAAYIGSLISKASRLDVRKDSA